MSTVYLHMGMPKTGTSALQMFLPQNNEVLHANGVDYPLMPFRFKNIGPRRNAHFLSIWEEKANAPEWEQGIKVLREALSKWDKVILSDEFLWTHSWNDPFWDETLAIMSELSAELRVIVYLRSQDEQVESNWNQKVKDQKTRITISFDRFMAEEMYSYMPFQYGDALDRISSYVGRENLTVRVYEKQQFIGGSLFADFLNILGLTFSAEYSMPPFTANVRLPNSAVEIKRMINFAYEGVEVPDFYRDIISDVFGMKEIQEVPEHDTTMFSPELRAAFMKKYEEQNAYVAREYLGRDDGILFLGKLSPLPQWQMDDHQILMDMIRIFAAEGVSLYRKQQELEKRNRDMAAKLENMEKAYNDKIDALGRQAEEMYNSLPFRAYRKIRDKKDGKNNE